MAEQPPKKKRRRPSNKNKVDEKAAAEYTAAVRAAALGEAVIEPSDPPPPPPPPVIPKLPAPPPPETENWATVHKPQKPSARAKEGDGRRYTVSVALPGSVINNAQSWELKTALVGQIARACAIFSVDEIVVFDEPVDIGRTIKTKEPVLRGRYRLPEGEEEEKNEQGEDFEPSLFMARILAFLECPQYLRQSLFELHIDLSRAGLLPPMDLPHHLRREDTFTWREGCVLPADTGAAYSKRKFVKGKKVVVANVGLSEPIEVGLESGTEVPDWSRVTVRMPREEGGLGRLVSPRTPTESSGVYWGYSVRVASSISKVLTECPYAAEGGYDLTIGTSERGQDIAQTLQEIEKPEFKHLLLVLGGLSGLELTIAADTSLEPPLDAEEASLLFDHWVNTLPGQGSRTVRTEEALLVSLTALRGLVLEKGVR